jgi:heme/copper-type cytochrome/quinol oxidase subunit 3
MDPFDLPLLNTLILLCSGTTVTWAHHSLIHGDRDGLKKGLWATILLGLLFTSIQAYEYASRRSVSARTPMARRSTWRPVSTASTSSSARSS